MDSPSESSDNMVADALEFSPVPNRWKNSHHFVFGYTKQSPQEVAVAGKKKETSVIIISVIKIIKSQSLPYTLLPGEIIGCPDYAKWIIAFGTRRYIKFAQPTIISPPSVFQDQVGGLLKGGRICFPVVHCFRAQLKFSFGRWVNPPITTS